MTHQFKLATPVALLIFNRPDRTKKVFETIRQAKPPVLLVVADGPRDSRAGEADVCKETRAIIDTVDWPCKVLTNYAEKNLGCRDRVSSGLRWVFEQVEEAIILEDDCVPHPTFFQFCEDLLIKYRDDSRVGLIGGDNFLPSGYLRHNTSYYFSRFTHIWGWATWRRAFQHYDLSMEHWPALRSNGWLEDIFNDDAAQVAHWRAIFNRVWSRELDTWDYQLTYSYWLQGFASICPSKNLVSNIGFGTDATHTHEASKWSELPVHEMQFPLVHPVIRTLDMLSDDYSFTHLYNVPGYKASPRSMKLYRYQPHLIDESKPEAMAVYKNLLALAMAAIQMNDPSTAVKLVQICEQDGVQLKDLYYVHGLCCLFFNDPIAAKTNLEHELALFPDNNPARELYSSIVG